jgi:hypothetical protein
LAFLFVGRRTTDVGIRQAIVHLAIAVVVHAVAAFRGAWVDGRVLVTAGRAGFLLAICDFVAIAVHTSDVAAVTVLVDAVATMQAWILHKKRTGGGSFWFAVTTQRRVFIAIALCSRVAQAGGFACRHTVGIGVTLRLAANGQQHQRLFTLLARINDTTIGGPQGSAGVQTGDPHRQFSLIASWLLDPQPPGSGDQRPVLWQGRFKLAVTGLGWRRVRRIPGRIAQGNLQPDHSRVRGLCGQHQVQGFILNNGLTTAGCNQHRGCDKPGRPAKTQTTK